MDRIGGAPRQHFGFTSERPTAHTEAMIDFGLSDPEVAAHFDRALAIIEGPVSDLAQQVFGGSALPMDSEIARLTSEAVPGPLDPTTSIMVAASAATGSLQQISTIFRDSVPSSPIVFQSLLRSALVGAARVIYVLFPLDPAERSSRVAAVLAQDASSGVKAYKEFTQLRGIEALRAPAQCLEDFKNQYDRLRESQPASRDGEIVDGMTAAIADALQADDSSNDALNRAILEDHAKLLWNTYSGLAHGYSWPRTLWGLSPDRRIPGDFTMDLYHVATCTQVALLAILNRSSTASASTTERVTLDGSVGAN